MAFLFSLSPQVNFSGPESICFLRMQECMKDTNSFATETGKKPARFIKLAVGMEESVDEFRILEDERCIDKGVPKSLSAARVGVCLRRYPAPATYQLHPPDTVRLVLPRGQLQGARWPCCLVPRARILKATRSGTPAQPSTAPISLHKWRCRTAEVLDGSNRCFARPECRNAGRAVLRQAERVTRL